MVKSFTRRLLASSDQWCNHQVRQILAKEIKRIRPDSPHKSLHHQKKEREQWKIQTVQSPTKSQRVVKTRLLVVPQLQKRKMEATWMNAKINACKGVVDQSKNQHKHDVHQTPTIPTKKRSKKYYTTHTNAIGINNICRYLRSLLNSR